MNVKDVVKRSIDYVSDVFASENISNLGLEEVTFDEAAQEWIVSVGFSRPWDYPKGTLAMLANNSVQPNRVYKTLRIRPSDGEVISIKNRQ